MNINNLTANSIREKIINKEIKAVEVTKEYIEKIEKNDKRLGGFLYVSKKEALESAKKVDEKVSRGEKLGILAGVPIGVKDNIAVKHMQNTCASKILKNYISPYDATCIEKIKKEDGIIIGKCNMDEFAMGSSNENSAYKLAKNPWDINRVPGGSSGGSAVVVSSNEAVISLGSDTGGSVRQPSSFCGVIGLKPTYGRVSRYGLTSFGSTLDQIGIFGNDIKDIGVMLQTIAGKDENDFTSSKEKVANYFKNIDKSIKGKKIGIPVEFFGEGLEEGVRKSVMEAIEVLKDLGAIIEDCSIEISKYSLAVYYILSSAEASSNLSRFDGIRYGIREEADNFTDIYYNTRTKGFGDEVKRRIMLGTYTLSKGYYNAYYKKALKVRKLIKDEYMKAFEKYDILLSPTSPTTAFKFGEKTDNVLSMYLADIYTVPVNIVGIPAISIPCGISNKMPVGIQFMANYFNEELLLNVANEFEKEFKFASIRSSFTKEEA